MSLLCSPAYIAAKNQPGSSHQNQQQDQNAQSLPAPAQNQTSNEGAQDAGTARSEQKSAISHGGKLPAGVTIRIQPNETITAGRADVGTAFSARVAEDILSSHGRLLLPKGTPAVLTVAAKPGHGGEIYLDLQSVNLDGQDRQTKTTPIGNNEQPLREIRASSETVLTYRLEVGVQLR